MKFVIVFSVLLVAVSAQVIDQPIPYSFNYVSEGEEGGRSTHQESGDGSGRVQGSYTVNDAVEGTSRLVEYIADENGFRATVRTNEPGTANLNPADVIMESSAPGAGAAPTYSSQPAPAPARPVAAGRQGVRYVLVPVQA